MDTLKLVYTQDEAFGLVDEYTEAYKKKIKQLEKENKKLKEENKTLKERIDIAKWVPYKNLYNDIIPRDENWFYKEVEPTC